MCCYVIVFYSSIFVVLLCYGGVLYCVVSWCSTVMLHDVFLCSGVVFRICIMIHFCIVYGVVVLHYDILCYGIVMWCCIMMYCCVFI